MSANLEAMLRARRVALVGASERIHYHGQVVRNLQTLGFPMEDVALVNPRRSEAYGLPCYASLAGVPGPVDVALIGTGAENLPAAVEDCAAKGVRAALVLSSGFAEAGAEGRERQAALVDYAARQGVSLIGPNSLGMVKPSNRLGLFASVVPPGLKAGNVSCIFQSGGMLNLFVGLMAGRHVGLGWAVVTGNEAMVTLADFLETAVDDPETGVIVLYLESVRNPALFRDGLERAAAAGKPVIALQTGLSEKGQRNVLTHSGNLASSGKGWTALLRQRNVTVVSNLDELLEAAALFSAARRLDVRPSRPSLFLMSVSGGDCTLLSDLSQKTGFDLPDLPAAAHERLVELVGKPSLADNPLDVGGLWRKGVIPAVAETVAAATPADTVAFRLNLPDEAEPPLLEAYATLANTIRQAGKLPIALTRASEKLPAHWYAFFDSLGIPFLEEYERALRALQRLVIYNARVSPLPLQRERVRVGEPLDWLQATPSGALSYADTERLFTQFGVPLAEAAVTHSPQEAAAAAERLGYPVAVKISSPDLPHRSDIGGVALGLAGRSDVEAAYDRVLASAGGAQVEGVIVQKMAQGGVEMILGVSVDPEVGPLVLLGLGGIFVEIFGDVAMRPAPLSERDVDEMLAELRGLPLLTGARGRPKADLPALRQMVLAVSDMAVALGGDLAELDLNPVMVLPEGQGVAAVDALVRRA